MYLKCQIKILVLQKPAHVTDVVIYQYTEYYIAPMH